MVIFDGISNYLGDLLSSLLQGFLFIISSFINLFISQINKLMNAVINLYNSIVGLGENITSFLTEFLTDLLPFAWISLIITGFLIVVVLRVYNLIRGR